MRGLECCCPVATSIKAFDPDIQETCPRSEEEKKRPHYPVHSYFFEVEVIQGYVAVGVANSNLCVTGGSTAAYDNSKAGGWMYSNSGDKFHLGQSRPQNISDQLYWNHTLNPTPPSIAGLAVNLTERVTELESFLMSMAPHYLSTRMTSFKAEGLLSRTYRQMIILYVRPLIFMGNQK